MKSIFTVAVILTLWTIQTAYYYPKLPDRVAVHFGGDGHADNWTSKTNEIVLTGTAVGSVAVFCVVLPCLLIRYIPDKWMNLPNRNYWLSDERKAATKRYIQNMMYIFALLTSGLLLAIFELAHRANLHQPVILSNVSWYLLGGYILCSMAWMIVFVIKFSRVQHS
jgi:uncharacterized membrane protein